LSRAPWHFWKDDPMSRLLDDASRSCRSWLLSLSLVLAALVFPGSRADAQYYGYGYPGVGAAMGYGFGYGYGFPGYGYGYGYGYPGFGYGYGYPGFGYGYGYPGFGYGGFYGGGFVYGGPGVSIAVPTPYGLSYAYGAPGPGVYLPGFSVGLTPSGVNSALWERYVLGRGLTGYSRGYGPVSNTGTVVVAPGTGTAPVPAPSTGVTRP
jgi:hypothetical protein